MQRGARPGDWTTTAALATLGWVNWHNHTRLHGALGDIPPAEHEEAHYAQLTATT